ncbi:hypothetical protein HFN55_31960 [Rhizobium leguminosarum]|nr:hypothetical protein [Rhizobium leguminosarum]MCA2411690.1 hypothetical protein [Rhizobium leguminosarum]NKM65925.1 hypothetical protein [Rhizobium leguminosarum bv. viciae]
MAFANRAGLTISNGASTCDVSVPCFLSNRHVIGNARVGARLNQLDDDMITQTDIGRLKCTIPVDVLPTTDVAIGQLTIKDVNWRMIRGIGKISGRVVPIGHTVYLKSGARTGVTRGEFLGMSQIRVDGHQYYAMRFSRAFGCNGDSGSLVVDGGRNLVGLYFAGEALACSQQPEGFALKFTQEAVRGLPGIVINLKD